MAEIHSPPTRNRRLMPIRFALLLAFSSFACGDEDMPSDAGRDAGDSATPADAGTEDAMDASTDSTSADVSSDVAVDAPVDAPVDAGRLGAAAWIRAHFADAPVRSGDFTSRTRLETPVLVDGADVCCGKYGFDVREEEDPADAEVGFVDVLIHDLVSTDAFGGGIQTANAPGATVFMADVVVDPGWPDWVSYAATNYDGLVLDASAAMYAEGLTIRDWNADGAIDNKADISQFVGLTISGSGHRGIRFWRSGPHYVVASSLRNEGAHGEGSVMWFQDCNTAEVRVWDSTFNGSPAVLPEDISCDEGSAPTIVYLTEDPRTTGEMHEMFSY